MVGARVTTTGHSSRGDTAPIMSFRQTSFCFLGVGNTFYWEGKEYTKLGTGSARLQDGTQVSIPEYAPVYTENRLFGSHHIRNYGAKDVDCPPGMVLRTSQEPYTKVNNTAPFWFATWAASVIGGILIALGVMAYIALTR